MKGKNLYLAVISMLMLVALGPGSVPAIQAQSLDASSTWYTTDLDLASAGDANHDFYTSLVRDSQGYVHISYHGPDTSLRHSTNSGDLWSWDVAYTPPSGGVYDSSMAVDSGDQPHISFNAGASDDEDLVYAWNTGGGWVVEVVTTTGRIGLNNDVVLDANGRAHISHIQYSDSGPSYLMYSTNASGAWVTTPVWTAQQDRTSIAVDAGGTVHITSRCVIDTQAGVCYLTDSAGAWQATLLDPNGSSPSLALDTQGALHVVYDRDSADLWYATNSGGAWTPEAVALGVNPGRDSSITVDAAHCPHVSYHNGNAGGLMYCNRMGGPWTCEAVDTDASAGDGNTIAIDSNHSAHISYLYLGTNHTTLRYATNNLAAFGQYAAGDDSVSTPIYGPNQYAQTFTAADGHELLGFRLKLFRSGNPGLAEVALKAADGRGRPTGPDLATATFDANSLTTDTAGQWVTIPLATVVTLNAGTTYAILLRDPPGSLRNCVYWRWDRSSPAYLDGLAARSKNDGLNWNLVSGSDMMFEVLGPPCMPRIEFTYLPPYGSFENLHGRVHCVQPDDYKIAVYIEVQGNWWTKPYFASPLTTIQPDHTWVTDITTGGSDQIATWIAAFLLPNGYFPDQAAGLADLPVHLFHDSIAYLVVERPAVYRYVQFSGRTWAVKASTTPLNPGPCRYSDLAEDVWVDADGRLHLTIHNRSGQWWCTEVFATDAMGYGTYTFNTASRVDLLDQNVVLGLFTWDDAAPADYYRELDIEFARWQLPSGPNAQYVVQPWSSPNHRHQFYATLLGDDSLHTFTWAPGSVDFASYQGHTWPPNPSDLIHNWSYTGSDVPPEGQGNARMNLWLYNGSAPSDGQPVEVVIESFSYQAP